MNEQQHNSIHLATEQSEPLSGPLLEPLPLGGFLTNRFGDRYLYSINHNAFNKIGSDALYQQHWSNSVYKENTLYLVAGSDSGIFISHIKKHGIPTGSRYLIIELPELIPVVETLLDDTDLEQKHISLCTVDDWLKQVKSCFFAEYAYLDKVRIIKSIAVEDAYLQQYSNMWRQLEEEFQLIIWQYRIELGNLTFITRQIENLAENQHSAYLIKDAFKGKTGVLLAGGPTLDDLLPWIKQHRDNLVLVSVSRIARRLQQLDIEPDIIVTVDPYAYSFDVSKHMLNFKNAILVNYCHACSLLVGQWRGRRLYLQNRYPWQSDVDKHTVTGRGPTVSNSAIDLMMAMGFSQIVLAGLDLCFSEEGFSHAEGSDERKVGARLTYGGQFVTTNEGKTAETDNSFFNALKSIEIQAREAISNNCQFINPSATAAAAENVKHIGIDEITIELLEKPALSTITDLIPKDDRDSRTKHYQESLKELSRARHKLGKLQQLAKDALEHNDGLFGKNGKTQDFKHKIKMDKIEKRLQKEFADFSNLSKHFGANAFTKTLHPGDSEDWTDDEVEEAARVYYEAYLDGSSKIIKVIDQQKQRLLIRMEEESTQPDFDKIFKQWEIDKQYARAMIWNANHSDQYNIISDDTKTLFDKLQKEFHAEIAKTDHSYMRKINEYASLTGVTSKALKLFSNNDIHGLNRMLKGLSTRTEPESKYFSILIEGYLAEIDNRQDDAISYYQTIVDDDSNNDPNILENPLNRLTVLTMSNENYDQVLVYLKRLCEVSPNYMPHYAEMLRITKDIEAAVNVYTDYLALAPDDLASMIKLGMLYKQIGVNEGATFIFNHVIEQDPHNKAARAILDELAATA